MSYTLPEPALRKRGCLTTTPPEDFYTSAQMHAAYAAGLAARVPEGWPTHAMVKAGVRTLFDQTKLEPSWEQMFEDAFKAAMLAAAPEPKP